MNFNLNIANNQSSISTKKNTRLAPYAIHHVTFDGAEIKTGTSKMGNDFKLLQLAFSNAEGSAEMSIFWPNPERDGERVEREAMDGHKYLTPSNWDQTYTVLTQTLEVLNPDGFKKMQELSAKFTKVDQFIEAFVKLVNKAIGAEADIKLNGYVNKQGYMQLTFPRLAGINKQGELFVADNYIGHGNLGLSDYELRRAKELINPQPTKMPKDDLIDVDTPAAEDASDIDLNFDDL